MCVILHRSGGPPQLKVSADVTVVPPNRAFPASPETAQTTESLLSGLSQEQTNLTAIHTAAFKQNNLNLHGIVRYFSHGMSRLCRCNDSD